MADWEMHNRREEGGLEEISEPDHRHRVLFDHGGLREVGGMEISRRRFLSASTALGTVAAVRAEGGRGCRIAIGTYGMQSMALAEALRLVAETGFDAVEIAANEGMTGSPAALSGRKLRGEIREILDGEGIPLAALMADLKPDTDDSVHRMQLEELARLADLAHELSPDSPPLIQTILGGRNWEESRFLFRDRLADWIQLVGDRKVHLSVKPHRSHAMSTPGEASWLGEQLGSPPRFGMVYDYSHYAFREPEMTITATVAAALPLTTYVAAKDAVVDEGGVRFALVGEGNTTDHALVLRLLHEGGYRGIVCAEVSSQIWRETGYDPVAATRTCYRNLVDAFEKAGVSRPA